MRKKIVSLVLAALFAVGIFSGCALIETDNIANYAQPVAIIKIAATGDKPALEKIIYKYNLIQVFNQQASSLIQQGYTVETAMEYCLNNLINRELLLNEINGFIVKGDIIDPNADVNKKPVNDLWKEIYTSIDSQILTIMQQIAEEFGEEPPVTPGTGTAQTPTYAVKTPLVTDDDEETEDTRWVPGDTVPAADDYLRLEALRKFANYMLTSVEESFLTPAQKTAYNADKALIKSYDGKKPADIRPLYSELQDMWLVGYLFFDGSYDSLKVERLEKFIVGKIEVADADVSDKYEEKLATQRNTYDEDLAAYKTALDGTTDIVLYHKPVEQFYVKHILIPFSEAQTAQLNAWKANEKMTQTQITDARNALALEIKTYEHRDGYDYTAGGQRSVGEVFAEVKGALSSYAGTSRAESIFEDLIFKYNTDPGIFNNAKGYGLRRNDTSSYMQEFTDAAYELYDSYIDGDIKLGAVYGKPVITDYGVHIMMLSSVLETGTVNLGDATSVNPILVFYKDENGVSQTRFETYYDLIKAEIKTERETDAFNNYQADLLQKLRNDLSTDIQTFPKRYADVIKAANG
ncbi:MAG: hypothetical protein LBS99_03335 [Clostridiales bacterium]|jgi:hypothetical protein|nr:hypothetical protein [Clostridiales bacterium]